MNSFEEQVEILCKYRYKKNPIIDENGWEIVKLHEMLNEANIPHEFSERNMCDIGDWDWGYHIAIYDSNDDVVISVIEGAGSYGFEVNLLEIMGMLTPGEKQISDVRGYLTAEEVFVRITEGLRKHEVKLIMDSVREERND